MAETFSAVVHPLPRLPGVHPSQDSKPKRRKEGKKKGMQVDPRDANQMMMAVQRRRRALQKHAPDHKWSPLDEVEVQLEAFRVIRHEDIPGLDKLIRENKLDITEVDVRLISGASGGCVILDLMQEQRMEQRCAVWIFLLQSCVFGALFLGSLFSVQVSFWTTVLNRLSLALAILSLLLAYPAMVVAGMRPRPSWSTWVLLPLIRAVYHLLNCRTRRRPRSPLNTYYRSGHVTTLLHLACCLESPSIVRHLLQFTPHFNLAERRDSTGLRPYELPLTEELLQIFKDYNWERRKALVLSYSKEDTPELEASREPLGNLVCSLPRPIFESIASFI